MGQQKAQLSPDASIARDLTSVSSAAHMEDLNVGKPRGELVRVRQGQKDQCVCVCMWLCGCIFMPAWCVRRSVSVSRMSGCVTVVWKLLPVNVCIWVCACVCLIFCLSVHIYIMCVKNTQAPPTPHLPVCIAELCQPTGGSIFIHRTVAASCLSTKTPPAAGDSQQGSWISGDLQKQLSLLFAHG